MNTDVALKDLLSPAATILSVLGGFCGVVWNMRSTRLNQQRKQAFDAYDAYLKDSFEYPKLANGQLIGRKIELPEHYKDGSDEFYQYEWFVARLMTAAEQILAAAPDDNEWKGTIRKQISKHREYIQTRFFHHEIYSQALQQIIKDVIDQQSKMERPPQRGPQGQQ